MDEDDVSDKIEDEIESASNYAFDEKILDFQ